MEEQEVAKVDVDVEAEVKVKLTRKQVADVLKEASANMFFRYRYSMTYELGIQAWGSRRADVIGNKISGDIVLIEVKSCVADFKTDNKLHLYLPYCDRMYLAFTKDVARKINKNPELMARIPAGVGVLVLEPTGLMRVVKKAKRLPVETSIRINILARLAWRAGDLSKRTTRSVKRIYLPGEPKLMPIKKVKVRRRTRNRRKYRARKS